MTIITGLVSIAGRFAGRLLNATLGWATLLLFGKVPAERQFLLLIIVFGSLLWVALLAGVLVPQIGLVLVAAVPLPDFIDPNWVRLAMLIGAVVVPLGIGAAALFVSDGSGKRTPASTVTGVLRGYPFAFALTMILSILGAVALVRKVRTLAHRWQDAHVPLVTKPGEYDEVLARVRATLAEADLTTQPRDAGVLLSGPPKLLDLVAGRSLGDLVPDRLMVLAAEDFEVLVYPSDLAITGTKLKVARARAALASRLIDAPAYLTTSAEAQEVEDDIVALRSLLAGPELADGLTRVDTKLTVLTVPFDEWETLYRQRLQVERDALRGAGASAAEEHSGRRPSRVEIAAALGVLVLVAADVMLLVSRRIRPGAAK